MEHYSTNKIIIFLKAKRQKTYTSWTCMAHKQHIMKCMPCFFLRFSFSNESIKLLYAFYTSMRTPRRRQNIGFVFNKFNYLQRHI